MRTVKDEIKTLMIQNDITYKELALSLRIDYHKLYYALNHNDAEIELGLYAGIMDYINRIRVSEITCGKVSLAAMKINARLTRELSELNRQVLDYTADDRLTDYEKATLSISLKKMKNEFIQAIDELLIAVGGHQ